MGSLSSLASYLDLVQKEEALQTAAVAESIQNILKIGKDLQQCLDAMKARLAQSSSRQLVHALKSGDKDEKALGDVLKRLDKARLELAMRIQLANVGITKSVRDGLIAAMPIVHRINHNVERVLDEGLRIARLLREREGEQIGSVTNSYSQA
jgi:hypothetical protein